MVLDAGRIVSIVMCYGSVTLLIMLQVEFDSPQALLKINDGKLRALVDESNDKDLLYAMAEKANATS